jgi:hypothetical protein
MAMANVERPADGTKIVEMLVERFDSLTTSVLEHLRALLEAGRGLVNCAESALMVPDEDGEHLRFLVSVNSRPGVAEIVTKLKVPCDRSLAGCVFTTGQLMSMANPEEFYQEVDKKTGLRTSVYLATPVVSDDETLGVATFLNRPEGQPQEPFHEAEIRASMQVADVAAAGLRFYQRLTLQQRLFRAELRRLVNPAADVHARLDSGHEAEEHSPLMRIMVRMERLSRREQELAADLLGVIATHGEGNG